MATNVPSATIPKHLLQAAMGQLEELMHEKLEAQAKRAKRIQQKAAQRPPSMTSSLSQLHDPSCLTSKAHGLRDIDGWYVELVMVPGARLNGCQRT